MWEAKFDLNRKDSKKCSSSRSDTFFFVKFKRISADSAV